jgi:hypothetical protein
MVVEAGQGHGALHAVLELAHVARPAVRRPAAAAPRVEARPPACRSARRSALRKCCASTGMSSLRSRSVGTVHDHHGDAVEEVFAEALGLTEGLEVAVGRGDDARVEGRPRGRRPPAARVRSCSARSSLACISRGISPISSRKRVPPLASMKSPGRPLRASVKAPRTCPKSSLSSRWRGTAAQLIATKGPWLPRAHRVDGAGHELLARAALAGDEHRGVGGRHPAR